MHPRSLSVWSAVQLLRPAYHNGESGIPKPSGITFGDHTFRKCLHLQTRKPKLGEAREAVNDHAHRCVDVQLLAARYIELGERQVPHACNACQSHRSPWASGLSGTRNSMQKCTFRDGLQLFAASEVERLERSAVADGCKTVARSDIPKPSGITLMTKGETYFLGEIATSLD